MANYRQGLWRISVVFSVFGFLVGLHWSWAEWPRIVEHREFASQFEQRVQALVQAHKAAHHDIFDQILEQTPAVPKSFVPDKLGKAAESAPAIPAGFEIEGVVVEIPGIGAVEFPGGMTDAQIRAAILRYAAEKHGFGKPAWNWYASLAVMPLLAALAPLALYGVVRWVAEGFSHAAN